MSDDIPMMSSGSVIGDRPASSGATIPPILATMEDIPTAVLRTTVGYSSALYTYRMAKEADAPNLPAKTGGEVIICATVAQSYGHFWTPNLNENMSSHVIIANEHPVFIVGMDILA